MKDPPLNIRAIIFDFDGLILETEVPDFECWQEIYREHDCELSFDVWAECIGSADSPFDPYDDLEAQLGRSLDRTAIGERRDRRYAQRIAALSIMPGVAAYLSAAKRMGMKRGVASSGPRQGVIGHLSRLCLLPEFDTVRCREDVQRAKPDPDLYLSVLEAVGVAPAQSIALEDSPNGIAAAKRAGMICVAIPTPMTRRLPLDAADLRLGSLEDLSLEDLVAQLSAEVGDNHLELPSDRK